MFYNHLIFSMVTLSLRIVLKYCVFIRKRQSLGMHSGATGGLFRFFRMPFVYRILMVHGLSNSVFHRRK